MEFQVRTFSILYSYLNQDEKHLLPPLQKNIHRAGWHKNVLLLYAGKKKTMYKTTNLQSRHERDEKKTPSSRQAICFCSPTYHRSPWRGSHTRLHGETIPWRREPAPLGHSQARHQAPRQVLPSQQFLLDHHDTVFIKEQTRPGEQLVNLFTGTSRPQPLLLPGDGTTTKSLPRKGLSSVFSISPHALLDISDACVQRYEKHS